MKKFFFAGLSFAFCLWLPFQALAQKEKWPSSIFICGGSSPQASIYILGAALSKVWNKYLGVTASPVTVQGTIGSLTRLAKREVDIGYSATTAYDLVFPPDPAKQEKEFPVLYKEKSKIRQMVAATFGAYHVFARTGISSFADLKGKRFAYQAPGWFGKPDMWETLFTYYKIDPKKEVIGMLEPTGVGDEERLFKEGLVDATIKSASFPLSTYTELLRDMAGKIHLLSLTEEATDHVIKKFPYYLKVVIPGGTYPGQNKDVIAFGFQTGYMTRMEMPEDFVYQLVKIYHEHLDEIRSYHPQFKKQLNLKNSVNVLMMPIHPGARRYYQEAGVWTEALEKKNAELLAELSGSK